MQFSDFAMLEREFETLDRGEARLNAMRDAVHEADVRQDLNWRFWFRYDYIEESIFCGDRYYALIMFPELLRLYEESPKLQEDSRCAHSMLVTFKWIVEAAPEFPQIPREEIDGYFREFRKQLRAQGKSLSAYYMKRSLFYMHVDMDIASMCFYRFLEEPLDDSSDGQALYYDQQAFYYLWVGAEEKALRAAQPIFDGKVRASSLPQATFHDFLRYYMNRGNFEEAERYGRMIEHRVNGDPYYHDIIGSLLSLYARLDGGHAIALFNRNVPDYLDSRNPWLRVQFAIGAAHLFAVCREDPALYEHFRIPGVSDPRAFGEEITKAAIDLAKKFDARNGTDDYMQMYLSPYGKE